MERAVSPSCRPEAGRRWGPERGGERRVKGVAAFVVVLLTGVRIAVERHDGAAVAEALLSLLQRERTRVPEPVYQQAGVGVPQL